MIFLEKNGQIFAEGTEQEIEDLKNTITNRIQAEIKFRKFVKNTISTEINKIKNYFLSTLQNSIK